MLIIRDKDEFAWPPKCCLNFYNGWHKLLFSSTDRLFDLSDNLMLTWPYKSRTIYLGLSTKSAQWSVWNEKNLSAIEWRIRHDLWFDGDSVTIKRITSGLKVQCKEEYLWRLKIRNL